MNVIPRYVPLQDLDILVVANPSDDLSNPDPDRPREDGLAILRDPHYMQVDCKDGMRAFPVFSHDSTLYGRALLKPPPKGGGFHQRIKTNNVHYAQTK